MAEKITLAVFVVVDRYMVFYVIVIYQHISSHMQYKPIKRNFLCHLKL